MTKSRLTPTKFSLLLGGAEWRREALRTNLWVVPTLEVIAAIILYAVTHEIDRAAARERLDLPPDGRLLRRVDQFASGMPFTLTVSDGAVRARVEDA